MKKTPQALKENIMGTMPENRLLITIAFPVIISMLIQSLYNVVDSYFVAKISEDALAAVALAFPVQQFMIAVSTGTAVGINALLSRCLGQKNQEGVNGAAMNGLLVAAIGAFVFAVLGVLLSRAFMSMQTDVTSIVDDGTIYLQICTGFSIGVFAEITFGRLLQSTGKTMYSMIGQITGALTNIVLDPILIFGLCGMPKMGVAGAAVATVAGQVLGAGIDALFNFCRNKEIQFSLRGFKPDLGIIKKIYAVGFPVIINNSLMGFMALGMNAIMLSFSTSAAAVMSVYFKLQSFIYMPIIGLNNGLIPIIAYNYGAQNKHRITKTIKLALIYASGFTLFGTVVFQLFPHQITAPFIEIPETAAMAVMAFKIVSIGFLFSGIGFVLCSVFQAMGRATYSLIIQFTRQIIIILPLAYLLSLTGNIHRVWWAFPTAELLSLALSLLMLHKIYKNRISAIPDK